MTKPITIRQHMGIGSETLCTAVVMPKGEPCQHRARIIAIVDNAFTRLCKQHANASNVEIPAL